MKKELPKVEANTDFVATYDKSKSEQAEVAVAINKFYTNDNEYEIGQEPENTLTNIAEPVRIKLEQLAPR